jgi:hypothetical protein
MEWTFGSLQVEPENRILDRMKARFTMTVSLGLLIVWLVAAILYAGEGDTGLVYGDTHAFFVSAPSGWILDNRSGLANGVHAAFYPQGSNWRDSAAVMYANGVGRSPGESVDSFIADDVRTFQNRSPQIQVKEGSPIKTKHGRVAQVRYFTGDQWGNHEAVAYITENQAFIIIALTARSQEAYERSLAAFAELVHSYTFISDDPKNEVDKFDLIEGIADDQSHISPGKEFDRACGVFFAHQHAKTMDACFGTVPNPDMFAFDVLVRVAGNGKPEKILMRPKTNMAECLVNAIKQDTFPIPPKPDYWWHLHMIIAPKRKTSTAL